MTNINVDASYVVEHMGDQLVIDLRPEAMYLNGHIPGAVNVDFWHLNKLGGGGFLREFAEKVEDLATCKDAPVILYCQVGMTSASATALLEAQGFTEIRHYAGGWEDWSEDVLRPVED